MKTALELACREFAAQLNDHVEETMRPDRRAVFDRHLSICSDCTAYLQSYKVTMSTSALAVRELQKTLSLSRSSLRRREPPGSLQ